MKMTDTGKTLGYTLFAICPVCDNANLGEDCICPRCDGAGHIPVVVVGEGTTLIAADLEKASKVAYEKTSNVAGFVTWHELEESVQNVWRERTAAILAAAMPGLVVADRVLTIDDEDARYFDVGDTIHITRAQEATNGD